MAEDTEKTTEATPVKEGTMSEAEIDDNLEETFPASDPPSWTLGTNHREESKREGAGTAPADEEE